MLFILRGSSRPIRKQVSTGQMNHTAGGSGEVNVEWCCAHAFTGFSSQLWRLHTYAPLTVKTLYLQQSFHTLSSHDDSDYQKQPDKCLPLCKASPPPVEVNKYTSTGRSGGRTWKKHSDCLTGNIQRNTAGPAVSMNSHYASKESNTTFLFQLQHHSNWMCLRSDRRCHCVSTCGEQLHYFMIFHRP